MIEEGGELKTSAAVTLDFPLNASLKDRAGINSVSFGRMELLTQCAHTHTHTHPRVKDDQTAGHTKEVKKRMHQPLFTPLINPAIVTARVIWDSLRFKQNIFPYSFRPLPSSVFSFGPRSKADVFICHIPDMHCTYEERLIYTFEMQMNIRQRIPCALDQGFWVSGVRSRAEAVAQPLTSSTH